MVGHLKCNGRDIPIDQYNYIEYGAECSAEANNGHSFSSWIENVGKNSTKIIAESNTQVSPFESLLRMIGLSSNDNSTESDRVVLLLILKFFLLPFHQNTGLRCQLAYSIR